MIKAIVVAVDGSGPGGKALAFAEELAAKHEARLILVHALLHGAPLEDLHAAAENLGFLPAVKADLEAVSEEIASMAMGHAGPVALPVPEETLEKIGRHILDRSKAAVADRAKRVETKMLADDPAAAILSVVEKESADLVVLGSRGFGRLKGLLLGSVSQKVVQDAPCGCLIVK